MLGLVGIRGRGKSDRGLEIQVDNWRIKNNNVQLSCYIFYKHDLVVSCSTNSKTHQTYINLTDLVPKKYVNR